MSRPGWRHTRTTPPCSHPVTMSPSPSPFASARRTPSAPLEDASIVWRFQATPRAPSCAPAGDARITMIGKRIAVIACYIYAAGYGRVAVPTPLPSHAQAPTGGYKHYVLKGGGSSDVAPVRPEVVLDVVHDHPPDVPRVVVLPHPDRGDVDPGGLPGGRARPLRQPDAKVELSGHGVD